MVGMGLTDFLNRAVSIDVSYGFGNHWSLTAEATISYKGLSRIKSTVESEHIEEFVKSSPQTSKHDLHRKSFIFSYWPSETFKGFSISAGIQSGSQNEIDIITGTSYTFNIWKGLGVSTGISIPLLEGIRNKVLDAQHIKVGINYRF
jgi:hypothetical protein